MLPFMSDINQLSLPTPFDFVPVSVSVGMALSTVFRFVNSPDNFPFSRSVLLVLSLCLIGPFNCRSRYEVSFSPDIIPLVDWTQYINELTLTWRGSGSCHCCVEYSCSRCARYLPSPVTHRCCPVPRCCRIVCRQRVFQSPFGLCRKCAKDND